MEGSMAITPRANPMSHIWIPATAALLVLIALGHMPYGFYVLLRLYYCVACAYYIFLAQPPSSPAHRLALGGLVVLYNPLILVHLGSKGLWTAINVATGFYFCLLEYYSYANSMERSGRIGAR
jgi:hypothetical protein